MRRGASEVPIEPLHLVTGRTAAVEQLRRLIWTQQFKPGDRLPSERELAERLGVSRTILREAVSVLEAQGLIRTRHGSGSYVTGEVSDSSLSSMWRAWYAIHRHDLIHILQVREALEVKAAMLAAANTTPELAEKLQTILLEMRAADARGDVREVAHLDVCFHGSITAASGNPVLIQLVSSLDSALEDDRIAVFQLRQRVKDSLRDHMRIIAAIQKRDPHAARDAVNRHFESVIRDVEIETRELEPSQDGRNH